ncbi:MAG TPA: hypothetical protein DDZ90_20595, partial [Planctomycetaceae bacterium]|nr:hypothetical protein [Planctomycetaceae bacterium]
TPTAELAAAQQKWESTLQAKPDWQTLTPLAATSSSDKTKLQIQDDQSLLASGPPSNETYTIETEVDLNTLKALRLEVLPDPGLPAQGPGRAADGNFVLSEISLTSKPVAADTPVQGQFLRIEQQGTAKQR